MPQAKDLAGQSNGVKAHYGNARRVDAKTEKLKGACSWSDGRLETLPSKNATLPTDGLEWLLLCIFALQPSCCALSNVAIVPCRPALLVRLRSPRAIGITGIIALGTPGPLLIQVLSLLTK
jgi:hypothetical protein